MDNLTKSQRTKCMSLIKRKDTNTELFFRKAIWYRGVRGYRLDAKLPGRPDLYFPKLLLAVFIDGCFWHKCPICYIDPKSNKDYWIPKIDGNVKRDRENEKLLKSKGIRVIRFWGHEVKNDLNKIADKFTDIYKMSRVNNT